MHLRAPENVFAATRQPMSAQAEGLGRHSRFDGEAPTGRANSRGGRFYFAPSGLRGKEFNASHPGRRSRLPLPGESATWADVGRPFRPRNPSAAPTPHSALRTPHFRAALTLIEMLISLACVLILMMAYTQLFSSVGTSINDARSMIELSNRMRSAENMLRNDLAGVTCDMTVWQRPESGAGYFEILEGPLSDRNPGAAGTAYANYPLGDTDDVLMFTARSRGTRFTGHFRDQRAESDVAEVVWFLRPTLRADGLQTDPPTYTLYRRLLLVMPTVQGNSWQLPTNVGGDPDGDGASNTVADFQADHNDVSARPDGSGNAVGNTLSDLTKRENRFAHDPTTFPHRIYPTRLVAFTGDRLGEDVVLTNVIGFDVQVWDSTAPVYIPTGSNVAVGPSDPGFQLVASVAALPNTPPNAPVGEGAYVDLNWLRTAWNGNPVTAPWGRQMIPFYSTGHPKPTPSNNLVAAAPSAFNYLDSWLTGSATGGRPATFDTWSFHYEHNGGVPNGPGDENMNGVVDEGTNGFDDPPYTDGVDDPGERETSPPYPVPLRGIKVTIRCYEPDSRQVREISVVESFVPE